METRIYGILFTQGKTTTDAYTHLLTSYTDADFTGDLDDRKSTSRWLYTFKSSPISWASKKQALVTCSSMDSELIAGSFESVEGIWLIQLGRDFKHDFIPIPLFTNNQSFISYSQNNLGSTRTKHIDIHCHYTRDQVVNGNIKLHYISTHENLADIFTKPLSLRKHAYLLDSLGVTHV